MRWNNWPAIELARAFAQSVNQRTVCAHCGAQPIEWHNPDHVRLNLEHRRIHRMVSHGRPPEEIQAEMDVCTPLCRRCHMAEDGRLEGFRALGRRPRESKPATPCSECQQDFKPLRRGLCRRCADRLYYRRKVVAAAGLDCRKAAGHA